MKLAVHRSLLSASFLLAIVLAAGPASAEDIFRTVLWESGQDGYHTYRIPAITVTRKGTLLAFCEGRNKGLGDSGDIDMLVKRSEDGGRTWSDQRVVWDDAANTCGNPCPVVDAKTGTVWLLMTWNRGTTASPPSSTARASTPVGCS